MSLSNSRGLIAAALLLSPIALAAPEPNHVSDARRAVLEDLRSPSAERRCWARVQLRRERNQTIRSLLELARSDSDALHIKYEKPFAIELLGEYRSVEACGFLIQQVCSPSLVVVVDEPYPLNPFPAAKALVDIGSPAISQILVGRMATAMSQQEEKLFAYIIWLHYAPQEEQPVGLFRMERLLEQHRAVRAKQKKHAEERGLKLGPSTREENLVRLIKTYKALKPHDPKDWPKP
jgi:hypothetical protein